MVEHAGWNNLSVSVFLDRRSNWSRSWESEQGQNHLKPGKRWWMNRENAFAFSFSNGKSTATLAPSAISSIIFSPISLRKSKCAIGKAFVNITKYLARSLSLSLLTENHHYHFLGKIPNAPGQSFKAPSPLNQLWFAFDKLILILSSF